jgi:hypothetical protein
MRGYGTRFQKHASYSESLMNIEAPEANMFEAASQFTSQQLMTSPSNEIPAEEDKPAQRGPAKPHVRILELLRHRESRPHDREREVGVEMARPYSVKCVEVRLADSLNQSHGDFSGNGSLGAAQKQRGSKQIKQVNPLLLRERSFRISTRRYERRDLLGERRVDTDLNRSLLDSTFMSGLNEGERQTNTAVKPPLFPLKSPNPIRSRRNRLKNQRTLAKRQIEALFGKLRQQAITMEIAQENHGNFERYKPHAKLSHMNQTPAHAVGH